LDGDSIRRLVAAPASLDVESALAPVSVPVGGGTATFGALIASCCGVIMCAAAAVAAAGAGAAAPRAPCSSRIIAALPNSKILRVTSADIPACGA